MGGRKNVKRYQGDKLVITAIGLYQKFKVLSSFRAAFFIVSILFNLGIMLALCTLAVSTGLQMSSRYKLGSHGLAKL